MILSITRHVRREYSSWSYNFFFIIHLTHGSQEQAGIPTLSCYCQDDLVMMMVFWISKLKALFLYYFLIELFVGFWLILKDVLFSLCCPILSCILTSSHHYAKKITKDTLKIFVSNLGLRHWEKSLSSSRKFMKSITLKLVFRFSQLSLSSAFRRDFVYLLDKVTLLKKVKVFPIFDWVFCQI